MSLSPAGGDDGSENAARGRIAGRISALSLAFLLATIVLFLAYRAAFLFWFARSTPSGETLAILLYGARLDGALVAAELMFIALIFLLLRYFRLRVFAVVLVALTFVHVLLASANILFFAERNQHLWEMLIANIADPSEIFVAVEPYVRTYPVEWIAGVLLFLALAAAAWRLCRRVPPLQIDLWQSRQRVGQSIVLILALAVPTLDVVAYQQTKYWTMGWIPLPAASQFYMQFDRYEANQAVINPVHDLIRFYLPATLASIGNANAHVTISDAIPLSQSLLGVRPLNDSYPLLRNLPPGPQLGLKNVVVIVVEGLSQSILHRQEEGQEVTPFLNDLSRRGLYFSNFVQSYNATDGSVFSTVTGMYKTFVNQHWQYFLPTEVNSYFGSLAHLLGKDTYKHYAMFGFHNRREDFTAFLRNQGFETYDIAGFHALLGDRRRTQEAGNALGLFDHVLFEETAKVLAAGPAPFTALLITATTHSPWVLAPHVPPTFKNARLNTFRYLDDSIRDFVAGLSKSLRSYDETLFVITGDHTSLTFGGDPMEQLRVPLIMYAPRVEGLASTLNADLAVMGSHVDIVPTVLQLLNGAHPYSGMGVSLISPERSNTRVVSSNRFNSLYFRDGFALRFWPSSPGLEDTQLFPVKNGQMFASDGSAANPALLQRLRHEFLALSETSARLTKEKRVFPMRRNARDMAGAD